MDLWTLAIIGAGGWVTTMWKLHGVSEELRLLRARIDKGAPLTPDEEAVIAEGLQPPVKKA